MIGRITWAFTAHDRLTCLHLDRFVLNNQGHAERSFFELDLNEQIWLPYQDEHQLGVRRHP